jgi:hypothetical protein
VAVGGGGAPIYRMKGRCSILTPMVKKLVCVVGGLGGGGLKCVQCQQVCTLCTYHAQCHE